MSEFPITIESVSLRHNNGLKGYHVKLIKTNQDKALVVLRFGKTGTYGQLKIERYDATEEADSFFTRKISERMSKGYSIKTDCDPGLIITCENIDEFSKKIGRATMPKIGASNLKHIFPDMDVSRIPEALEPTTDENGRYNAASAAAKARQELLVARKMQEEAKRQEEQRSLEEYRRNPAYGVF